MKIPQEYLDMTNDFGFTAVDDDEVADPIVQSYKSQSDKSIDELAKTAQGKLLEVERLIMPLLVNLLKDAETKHYIKWPNRKAPIERFMEKLLTITRSE
tara:strand:+ start:448 stop:744 length:297 start_codon:yes stop_codon:yes gene_type:complete